MLKKILFSLLAITFITSSASARGSKLTPTEAQNTLVEIFGEGSRSTVDGCQIKVQKDSSGFTFEIYRGTEFPFVFLFNKENSSVPFYIVTAGNTTALTQDFDDSFMFLQVVRHSEGTEVVFKEDIAREVRTIRCTLN